MAIGKGTAWAIGKGTALAITSEVHSGAVGERSSCSQWKHAVVSTIAQNLNQPPVSHNVV